MSRFRNWSFTDFSLSTDYEQCIPTITYIIYGEEKCPTTGNLHHQGYFEMSEAKTMKAIKKALKNNTIHLEPARSGPETNKKYCSKENIKYENGTPKQQGKRTDLETVRELIKEGKEDYEIIQEIKSIQSVKMISTIRQMSIPPRTEKPKVQWFYGETGTGKTETAVKIFENDYDDISYENNFIIGYTGKKNVLWDEFRGQIPLNRLLKMLDKYKCTINVKGGQCNFSPSHIIITSCFHPSKCYKACGENIEQLLRRIDEIKHFTKSTQKKSPQKSPVILEATSMEETNEFIIEN